MLPALDALGVEVRRVPLLPMANALDTERPTVLVIDRALAQSVGDDRTAFDRLAEVAAIVGVGDPGQGEPADPLPTHLLASYVTADAPPAAMRVALQGALRHAATL